MINRSELSSLIVKIGYDILDKIVSPVCGIGVGMVDLYLVDIETYTMGDEEQDQEIIEQIHEKYGVSYMDDEDKISHIDNYMPIALIALYIIENGKNVQGVE